MEVKIRTQNFASNAGVKELAEKELKRVESMFVPDTIFDVCVKKENRNNNVLYKCDVTVKNGKQFIRGYAQGDSVVSSIDGAVDSLKRKARKIKTISISRREKYSRFFFDEICEEPTIKEMDVSIERVKEIEPAVMTPEDAVVQMELSGHEFFLFRDDVGRVCLVYKRDESGYGELVCN